MANIIQLYFIIFVSLLIHELGHVVVAKFHKVSIESVKIGIGPEIFNKTIYGTIFSLSIFPFEANSVVGEENDRLPTFKKLQIDMAGILFNIIAMTIAIYFYMGNKLFFVFFNELGKALTTTDFFFSPAKGASNHNIAVMFIGVNLFIIMINLIPFPHLDGGKIFVYGLEKILYKFGFSKYQIKKISSKINVVSFILFIIVTTTIGLVFK